MPIKNGALFQGGFLGDRLGLTPLRARWHFQKNATGLAPRPGRVSPSQRPKDLGPQLEKKP
jgi:hypothetical protein